MFPRMWWLRLVIALCCALPALPAWAAPGFGLLRGSVVFDDGAPYVLLPVLAKYGETTIRFTTEEDGTFGGLLPTGTVSLTAPGVAASVNIRPGEQTVITLQVQRIGVLLVADAPKSAPDSQIDIVLVEWTAADGKNYELKCPVAPGKSWFPEVPATARAFSVKLWWQLNNMQYITGYTWSFDKPAVKRILRIPLAERFATPQLALKDDRGHPLARTTVELKLSWTQNETEFPAAVECRLVGFRTDANGQLPLPQYWLPGKYRLAVTVNGKTSPDRSIEFTAGGKLVPAVYHITGR